MYLGSVPTPLTFQQVLDDLWQTDRWSETTFSVLSYPTAVRAKAGEAILIEEDSYGFWDLLGLD